MTSNASTPPKVLGLATSPRRGGNSEMLLDAFLSGATEAGAEVRKLALSDLRVAPCRECGGCDATGVCVVRDDAPMLYDLFKDYHRLVLATPIYFLHMCAQAKALVDRAQAPWVLKTRLKRPFADPPPGIERRGFLLACGGSNARELFDCTIRSFRAFLSVVDVQYAGSVCVPRLDAAGDAERHPTALSDARRAGAAFVA
jgi:hypothetical protein